MVMGAKSDVHPDEGDPDHDIPNEFFRPSDPDTEDISGDDIYKSNQHGQDDTDDDGSIFKLDESLIELSQSLTPWGLSGEDKQTI